MPGWVRGWVYCHNDKAFSVHGLLEIGMHRAVLVKLKLRYEGLFGRCHAQRGKSPREDLKVPWVYKHSIHFG